MLVLVEVVADGIQEREALLVLSSHDRRGRNEKMRAGASSGQSLQESWHDRRRRRYTRVRWTAGQATAGSAACQPPLS